jgi:hypothetical protein
MVPVLTQSYKYFHLFLQPSPPSISRSFFPTETQLPLNINVLFSCSPASFLEEFEELFLIRMKSPLTCISLRAKMVIFVLLAFYHTYTQIAWSFGLSRNPKVPWGRDAMCCAVAAF